METQTPAAILANQESYYEAVTRRVRWFGILAVVLTFPTGNRYYHLLLAFATLGIGFNLLRYSRAMRWRPFASRVTSLLADNLLIGVLLVLSGGVGSAYFVYTIFTITSAAYWYGRRGTIIVLGYQISIVAILAIHSPASLSGGLAYAAAAKILGICGIGYLTERLTQAGRTERFILARANQEIERERQSLLTLINSLADAVVVVASAGGVLLYNGATLELLNTNIELTGQALSDKLKLIDEYNRPVEVSALITEASVTIRRSDLRLVRENEQLNLDISISPVHDPSAGPTGPLRYVWVLRDITAAKSLEQQQQDFISVASHELRTPVAIVEANLSTALLPGFAKIDDKARALVDQAHQNTIFLGELIKDLGTLARAEHGSLAVDLKVVDPRAVLEQLERDYQAQADKAGLALKLDLAKSPKPFTTSEFLLHEILQNFLTNAIKYTEHGSVTLATAPSPTGSGAVFTVADTGIGISSGDKKQLFSKFYRSSDERTQRQKGTGLGLYISTRLADRLGASITYHSKLNAGSTFIVQVPPYHKSKDNDTNQP